MVPLLLGNYQVFVRLKVCFERAWVAGLSEKGADCRIGLSLHMASGFRVRVQGLLRSEEVLV